MRWRRPTWRAAPPASFPHRRASWAGSSPSPRIRSCSRSSWDEIQIALAVALGECFIALRAGRDFRAGLWLGAFLLKPQYGLFVGLALLAKGHLRVAAGTAAVFAALLVASLVTAGPQALLHYPQAVLHMEKWDPADVRLMANGRSIVALVFPDLSRAADLGIALGLAALTLAAVIPSWRGALPSRGERFTLAFTLVVLATLLAGYHLFAYGAAILIVPLAAALSRPQASAATRLAGVSALLAPTLPFTLLPGPGIRGMEDSSNLLALLLVVLFASLVRDAAVTTAALANPCRGRLLAPASKRSTSLPRGDEAPRAVRLPRRVSRRGSWPRWGTPTALAAGPRSAPRCGTS